MLERYLAITRRRIVELKDRVETQRVIVAQLEANRSSNEGIAIARDVLRTMEQNLQRQISHERQLGAKLPAWAES